MTTQQWVNTAIKTIISLFLAILIGSAVWGLLLDNVSFPIDVIAGLLTFVFVGYKLLPKVVKEGIKNW